MRFASLTVALATTGCLVSGAAIVRAQGPQQGVGLDEILARARAQAPEIVSASLALDEARGRLAGASLRVTMNPELDLAVGGRRSTGNVSTDIDVGLSQMFEPASRRSARLAGANAAIDRTAASLEQTTRLVVRLAAGAFYQSVQATQRARLAAAAEDLAIRVVEIADQRFRAGDTAVLDVNIARAALARVRSERQASAAAQAAALGDLQALLSMPERIQIRAELTPLPPVQTGDLWQAAGARPEIRELEAAIREADADVQLGQSFGKSEYGFGFRYSREGKDNVLLGGLTLALPVAAKGQELLAVGSARKRRLQAELAATQVQIRIRLDSALDVFSRRVEAARLLERDALPGLDENDELATRSFEVGQIGLTDLLLIRREILETRVQYLNAWLEAMLAYVDLQSIAGVLK